MFHDTTIRLKWHDVFLFFKEPFSLRASSRPYQPGEPIRLLHGILATDVALRTLCEALTKAGCSLLELEPKELQAEYRPALTPAGRLGEEAEIYLYDTLPGGAGFSRRIGDLGLTVFDKALQILESCPEGCDRSCYRCLIPFRYQRLKNSPIKTN